MKISQIEHFVAVVEEKSFANAAKKCYISRQAISHSIRQLSEELNIDLVGLDEYNQPYITENGQILYIRMKDILERVEKVRLFAEEINKEQKKLNIAFSDTLAPILGKEILCGLKRLQSEYKNQIGKIEQVNNNVLAAGVRQSYDLIIMMGDSSIYDAYVELLFQIPMVLTIPYTNELYNRKSVSLTDLQGQTVIYPATENSFHLDEISKEYRITWQAISNFYTTGHTAIENGWCILDAKYAEYDKDLVQKEIVDFTCKWDVFAIWDKNKDDTSIRKVLKKLKAILNDK